jgi:hypothetical protein
LEPAAAVARLLRSAGTVIESTIEGRSMGATLPVGTRIRIRCVEPDDLVTGDTIAYLLDGRPVAHRLVARCTVGHGRGWLVTRGDATILCDLPVRPERLVGMVVAREVGGTWKAVDAPPARRGWRAAAAGLLAASVAVALALDVRVAKALVRGAVWSRRLKAALTGRRGHRVVGEVTHEGQQ